MSRLVLHDRALAAQRDAQANALSLERARRQNPGGFSHTPPPPEDSPFMKRMRAASIERAIQQREDADRRRDGHAECRPYNRRKDYYKTLRLPKDCSAAEVRRAYRRLSLRFHPDKQLGKSDRERALAAAMFEELKEANNVLSHDETRLEYDQVHAVAELLEREPKHTFTDTAETMRRVQPPARRAPPTYVEVELSLEEFAAGCVRHVEHERRGNDGRRHAVTLQLRVPPGAATGAEFVFAGAGDASGGGAGAPPADVVCVMREAAHSALTRQGCDLIHLSGCEATATQLLVCLRVPTLGGGAVTVIAHTLAARLLGSAADDAQVVCLPGLGLPRRSRRRATARDGATAQATATTVEATPPAGVWPKEAVIRFDDSDDSDGSSSEDEEEGGSDGVAPSSDAATPSGVSRGSDRGDLLVFFSVRACRPAPGAPMPTLLLPTLPKACWASVLLLGPRPRPAPLPTAACPAGLERNLMLRRLLLPAVLRHLLPEMERRWRTLRSPRPAQVLCVTIGGVQHGATPADEGAGAGAVCIELLRGLAPAVRVRRLALTDDPHLPLLDDEAALIYSSSLVLLHTEVFTGPGPVGIAATAKAEIALEVIWSPGVRVRAAPSLSAAVVGVRRTGDVVTAVGASGGWVRIDDGWVLADGDKLGLGQLLRPLDGGATHAERSPYRSSEQVHRDEATLRALRRHPAVKLLAAEHFGGGLPLIASEDATALLGSGAEAAGDGAVPWVVRPLRGAVVLAALQAPTPPPAPEAEVDEYVPPPERDQQQSFFELFGKNYGAGPRLPSLAPPPPFSSELDELQRLCGRLRAPPHGGLHAVGLAQDCALLLSGGARFAQLPVGCALLERRHARAMRRWGVARRREADEEARLGARLEREASRVPLMRRYVEPRAETLALHTDKELRRWFESSGHSSPSLDELDERRRARARALRSTADMQTEVAERQAAVDSALWSRCARAAQ